MSAWTGVADCPKCGCEGTLLVHGETSTVEIDGCWVCGCGRNAELDDLEFVPLKQLKMQQKGVNYKMPRN
jgi:hypothetical protein